MSGFLSPDPRLRELSDLGLVQAGALLHTYVSGTPSTPLTTYNNVDLAAGHENANPIVASAGGLFGPIYLVPGTAYKYVLTDALGNALWQQDPVGGPSAGLTAPVLVTQGGTGIIVGISGGIPYFSSTVAIASSALLAAHGVVLGGGAGVAPLTTAAGVLGQVLTSNGPAADPTFQASAVGQLTLLKAASGTDASAGATNLDTVAIAGLTAKDLLLVHYELESVVQTTTAPILYNSTDAVTVGQLAGNAAGSNVGAGVRIGGTAHIGQRQAGLTSVFCRTALARSDDLFFGAFNSAAFATNWTGAWTLALRHGGVTAGGTCSWVWSVYKLAGQ